MVRTHNKKDGNLQLSQNFVLKELACKCSRCRVVLADDQLVGYLQKIRSHFGEEVIITSGYRCPEHNAAVGGAAGSWHTKGMAADFMVNVVAPAEVAKYAESIGVKGIGLYEGKDGDFVHIDTRENKSFWYGHAQEPRATFGGAPKQTFTVELSVLRRGCEGDEVRALQAQLKGYGYPIVVDGIYGAKTENAVMCYQEDNGLTADGVAGPVTRSAMLGLEGG